MIEEGQDAIKGNRIYFLDNLRTFMIFLVVLFHAHPIFYFRIFYAFIIEKQGQVGIFKI